MRILLLGAYGYTGSLICQTLHDANIPYSIAGRNSDKLGLLQDSFETIEDVHTVDIKDINALATLIERYDVFINTIGPFNEYADKFLHQIAHASHKYYFDISGELNFVQESKDQYHTMAKKHFTTIVHGVAFESVINNLLFSKSRFNANELDSIYSYYQLGKAKPSPGTRITMKLSKFRNNFHIKNYEPISTYQIWKAGHQVDFLEHYVALPFPLPEVSFFHWDINPANVGSFLLSPEQEASFYSLSEQIESADKKTQILNKFESRKPSGPSESQRKAQAFTVYLQLVTKSKDTQLLTCKGHDMYHLSAEIMTYFIKKTLQNGTKTYGVISPLEYVGMETTFFEDLSLETYEL